MAGDTLAIVAELLAKNYQRAQISEETGLSPTAIARLVRKGRELGVIPPRQPASTRSKIKTILKAHDVQLGSIQNMIEALPEEIRFWLLNSMPEDVTLAEFTASIIVDAYHDEKGAQ